jgi:hypothetical protein
LFDENPFLRVVSGGLAMDFEETGKADIKKLLPHGIKPVNLFGFLIKITIRPFLESMPRKIFNQREER